MIPILYTADETKFITNGIGRLAECTRCIATEERNGIYEIEFDYPITGEHYDKITRGRIVTATHDDRGDIQPFIIYERTIPDLNGIVTFKAHHISYKLVDVVVGPYQAGSCAAALEGLVTHAINANPFSFWTDKTTVASFDNDEPRNVRNMLAGEQNSILDVFGSGEYEFDKFDVKLYAHRGNDTDCEIRYGKNLVDLNQKINDAGSFNAIVPFWKDSEGNILMLPEEIIVYDGVEPQLAYLTDHNLIIIRTETDEPIEVAYRQIKAAPMDMSDAFEEMPTVAQLRAAAQARFESGGYWLPDENIEVDFVQLWQTEEYKDYSALQRVRLCDTVSVFYPQGGVFAVKQKVVKTVYNVLLDRYDKVELGALQTSLGQAVKAEVLQDVPTTSMMESAIQYATEMIRGGLGGYVVMTPGPNGYPQEILIMDTPDVDTAVNVWRFNQGGLGHSSNGYQGPFSDIALTADGRINASIITTGTLNANVIKAGILSDINNNTSFNLSTGEFTMKKGTINLGNGNFVATDGGRITAIGGGLIRDPNSNTVFNLDTGAITIKNGSINLGSGAFVVTSAGVLTANSGKIGPFTIGASALIYETNSDYASVGNTGIGYRTNSAGTTRRGVVIDAESITFGRRTDQSAWGLTAIARLNIAESMNEWGFELRSNSGRILWGSADSVAVSSTFFSAPNISSTGTAYVNRFQGSVDIFGALSVSGTKNRRVKTDNYQDRLLYCYETPTPLFGDIGEAVLDSSGLCYVDIDDIFTETVADKAEYQVFLQKEGDGDCWIAEKTARYFVIRGTPNLKVAWELKAKQKDYENLRLEVAENSLDEYEHELNDYLTLDGYIAEQEELLYG